MEVGEFGGGEEGGLGWCHAWNRSEGGEGGRREEGWWRMESDRAVLRCDG